MSNVIRFLESLGNNSVSGRLSPAEYAATVATLKVEPLQRQALLDRDVPTLSELLKGREMMFCMIAMPDDGETQDVPDGAEEEPDSKEPEKE